MRWFATEKPQAVKEEVEEVYLFNKSGELLGHIEPKGGGKKDVLGDMITTVSNFSKDAMIKGKSTVDSIEYGNRTLIMEVTNELGLVVVLKGKDNPNIRQRMRDVLHDIYQKYPGMNSELKGVESLLKQMLTK